MDKRIALVTGGSRGLGKEFCFQLASNGYTVLLAARSTESGKAVEAEFREQELDVTFKQLDVADEEQMKLLAADVALNYGKLDLLINNAGINSKSTGRHEDFLANVSLKELSAEQVLHMIRINSLSGILMAKYFLDVLKEAEGPKIVNISSWLGSLSLKTQGGNYSYAASKAALNMMSRAMAFDVKEHGIVAAIFNPGWVQTDMGGPRAKLTVQESVSGILEVVENLSMEDVGKFLQWDGSEHPW